MISLAIFILLVVIYFFGKDIRHRWFAYFMSIMQDPNDKDPRSEELKKDLFKPLASMVSNDPNLRSKKSLKILEIGVGTGTNFEFYPDGTQLVVIDPNPHFSKYYNENRSKFTNIDSEEIIITTGEEMDMVEDGSVDAVVVTLVLCSIVNIDAILRQVKRVLAPGGKFFFMEHIAEFDDSHWIRRCLQDALTACRIWPFFFDGCMLNRDFAKEIHDAGFANVEYKRIHAPVKNFVLSLISPHMVGFATK